MVSVQGGSFKPTCLPVRLLYLLKFYYSKRFQKQAKHLLVSSRSVPPSFLVYHCTVYPLRSNMQQKYEVDTVQHRSSWISGSFSSTIARQCRPSHEEWRWPWSWQRVYCLRLSGPWSRPWSNTLGMLVLLAVGSSSPRPVVRRLEGVASQLTPPGAPPLSLPDETPAWRSCPPPRDSRASSRISRADLPL